jgi:uracil-DNA glycosylase
MVTTMTKTQEFEEIKSECLKCKACTLSEKRTQVVFGEGNIDAALMFIGEAPGEEEDKQGIPFVGRAGQLLTKSLEAVNIKRGVDTYITNVCKCRPPNNRTPEREEANACNHWLQDQIRLIKPKIIVLVGSVAMKAIMGETQTISKMRGTWHKYAGIDTTVIFHPAYLLRNPTKDVGGPKWLTWQDLKAIKSAVDYHKL